jgi:hypothetical protein
MNDRTDEQGRKLVPCDDADCTALDQPESIEEFVAAVEHWREHSYLSGCSHGD